MSDVQHRPLTSLQSVILTTGPFIFLWTSLRNHIQRNGAISFARTTTKLNNEIYSIFSFALGGLILNDVFQFYPLDDTIKTNDIAYIYHLSKFYEYTDIFNLVAGGKVIGPHMAFHHLTTPFLTHFRVLNATDWQVFAFLNCVHHFWLYAYLGGVGLFRPILPVTGWLQLVAGIAVDVLWLFQNGKSENPEATNRLISVLLLTRYAMLYYEHLKKGGTQDPSEGNVDGKKE
ncbi:hypothetical protein LTR84_006443 [Exophiala bonariae]|uniref:TLC domain-containing protein n=1 Tax=Exophiala bonariae TaxID=1690606 RepID=A0AAV9N1W8_9EURO|nr:hypothetical protein LTR84_006443 [Exophiala bonariae]